MSTSAPAIAPQRTAPVPTWVGLALAFAIGTAGGAAATYVIAEQAPTTGAPVEALAPTQAELTSLVSKADAAMARGDVRLAIHFREDLAAAVGTETADQLTHMAAKADAAAARGDVRLSLQFREDLAAAIAAAAEGE